MTEKFKEFCEKFNITSDGSAPIHFTFVRDEWVWENCTQHGDQQGDWVHAGRVKFDTKKEAFTFDPAGRSGGGGHKFVVDKTPTSWIL